MRLGVLIGLLCLAVLPAMASDEYVQVDREGFSFLIPSYWLEYDLDAEFLRTDEYYSECDNVYLFGLPEYDSDDIAVGLIISVNNDLPVYIEELEEMPAYSIDSRLNSSSYTPGDSRWCRMKPDKFYYDKKYQIALGHWRVEDSQDVRLLAMKPTKNGVITITMEVAEGKIQQTDTEIFKAAITSVKLSAANAYTSPKMSQYDAGSGFSTRRSYNIFRLGKFIILGLIVVGGWVIRKIRGNSSAG